MKKILSLITVLLLAAISAFSQTPAPGIFNYQGVARNSVGNALINKAITLRLTIHDGSAAGPVVYQESRTVTTNPFGLFNVQVGSAGASNVTGTIAGVNLGTGGKFIQVEIDPNGGTVFINIGAAQLASVPYSLYSSLANDLVLPFNKTQADAGALFKITNSGSGITLHTTGPVRLQGINEAANRILSSDAVGNATWKDPAAINILTSWSLTGNPGTNPTVNFIGTTDDNDVIFKRNNIRAGFLGGTNTSFGSNALNPLSTGGSNTANGFGALSSNTTGTANTANGANALARNINGTENTANGVGALFLNISGNGNTANGTFTLLANTSGDENTANGAFALRSNLSGLGNTANGRSALYSNTTGNENTANGRSALYSNTTGFRNTANGVDALFFNTTGSYNTANGASVLYANTTGAGNTANGYRALYFNTTGDDNTANGVQALFKNTNGANNTANGTNALYYNTNGANNTANGYQALNNNDNGGYNTADGVEALYNNNGSFNTANGYQALYRNFSGNQNTASGYGALDHNSTGINNTAVGAAALSFNTIGDYNTALGYNANVSFPGLTNATAIGFNAVVDASSKVRIGNTSVTSIGGNVGWTNFSDGRIKKNIKENVPGLAFINLLTPITYNFNLAKEYELMGQKDSMQWESKNDIEKISFTGFVAQDVEAAAKKINYDFSGVDKTGKIMGLRYSEFVVPLVKAMQEQQAMITTLQKQVEAAKAEIPLQTGKQQTIMQNQQKQIDLLEKRLAALEAKK